MGALRETALLDTLAEPAFDRLTSMASTLMETPIAVISLVDRDRQWFKSVIGLDRRETDRSIAFCDHAIRGSGLMVVEDALEDPRFRDNPLVTGAPGIRFYAGAPLRTEQGLALGALCVIDRRPRRLSDQDQRILLNLAAITMDEITLRSSRRLIDRQSRDLALALTARGNFLALVSHEMRTPLNAVMGFAELIASEIAGPLGDPKYLRYAANITTGAARLLEFVEGVVELAALDSRQVELKSDPMSLEAELHGVVERLAARAMARKVTMTAGATPGMPDLVADRLAIRQIIERLALNGLCFTPSGGSVQLAADWDEAERCFILTIRDSGVGIPADRLAVLNEAMALPDQPLLTARAEGALGLGLAIVRRLVAAHGGRCVIERARGRGTLVTLRLPMPRPRDEAPAVA